MVSLFLHDNELTQVPRWQSVLGANAVKLERLQMNNNQIAEVPANSFWELKGLQGLWLNDMPSMRLFPGSFGGLNNLTSL